MKLSCVILLCALLAGCVSKLAISDISDSSVKIRTNGSTPDAEIQAAASRGCGNYSKQAVRIGQTCFDVYCYQKEVLFACN